MKLYTKAQGTKTMNLIINMEGDEDKLLFSDDACTLQDYGCGRLPPPAGAALCRFVNA